MEIGRLVATPGAISSVPASELLTALLRHANGDWGEVDVVDWQLNDDASRSDGRVMSCYRTEGGVEFWITTEADRSATTFLLPEEY